MTEAVKALLEKAEQSVNAAESLLNDDYMDFAASRAYYAMFYAVEALLLNQELSFSKHSAVIAAFGKEFVKTGIFDIRFHRSIINAFDLRNTGDYGCIHAVTEENARQSILEARELLDAVRNYLS